MKKTIRLGTRGSPLALIQAEIVRRLLLEAHPALAAEVELEIVPICTSGDWRPEHKEKRFVELGGNKGLFTKEIEEALVTSYIDMAVHSMKDVANLIAPELEIAAILKRDDPRDAFIGRAARSFDALPRSAVVGTSSLRRQAQILAHRPDLRVVALRGNVETRLQKLESGLVDAAVLAAAGMTRLGLHARISSLLSVDVMLPAASQGILGIEIRKEDAEARALLAPLNDPETEICMMAERAVMRAIDGNCNTPAGAHARLVAPDQVALEALVARVDGTDRLHLSVTGHPSDADQMGGALGNELRARSPLDIFRA